MKPLRSDSALDALMTNGLLKGLSGTYVDDLLRCGNSKYRRLCKKTHQRFDMAQEEELPCTFTGFKLRRTDDGLIEDPFQELQSPSNHPLCDGS